MGALEDHSHEALAVLPAVLGVGSVVVRRRVLSGSVLVEDSRTLARSPIFEQPSRRFSVRWSCSLMPLATSSRW